MMKKILILLITTLFTSCAHVGKPKPPFKKIPLPPHIDKIYQRGTFLYIFATLPLKNSDSSPIKFYRNVILYCGKYEDLKTPEKVDKTIKFGKNEFYEIFSGRNRLKIRLEAGVIFPKIKERFLYIKFINDAGRLSPPSNIEELFITKPLDLPYDLKLSEKKNYIQLMWKYTFPSKISGFNIYKSTDGKTFKIIKTVPSDSRLFEDKNFQYGKKYFYRIDSFKRFKRFKVYSNFTKTLSITPRDIFPPEIPSNISYLIEEKGRIKIIWDPVLERDLKGYNIYRKVDDGKWIKVNKNPVDSTVFEEKMPEFKKSIKYKITSVDNKGNESSFSKIIEIKK